MTKEAITMSQQEVDRLQVIQRTSETREQQAAAARQLGLNVRHVKRLVRQYWSQGAAGLVSRRRGQRPRMPSRQACERKRWRWSASGTRTSPPPWRMRS